jgi:hypothetical protein
MGRHIARIRGTLVMRSFKQVQMARQILKHHCTEEKLLHMHMP